MGIYDRDYHRDDRYDDSPGFHIAGPQTVTTKIVIVTAAVYLLQLFSSGRVTEYLVLEADWYRRPWQVYELLTYGFVHSDDLWHIILNMFGLWLFGRDLENRYGPREFVAFYVTGIIAAGIVWTLAELTSGGHALLGASGGVAAVVILFAFNFPYRTVLFMFVIPMPMWVLALIIVATDAMGAVNRSGNVAFTAHLGGALFAALYYKSNIRLASWLPQSWSPGRLLRPRPQLRVHEPDEDEETPDSDAVDEILRKIQEQGQDSLTRRERRILEQASREYQKKRR
jgi:membrane associated rhomboid family serine protease